MFGNQMKTKTKYFWIDWKSKTNSSLGFIPTMGALHEGHLSIIKKSKDEPKKPKKKKRDDYIEETFLDWNLPEMTDEEYNKLVDQVDNFLRNWEKKYIKLWKNEYNFNSILIISK